MPRKTFECPNCGAEVVVGKKSCRECGSDATTGWMSSEEIDYQSIDIPEGYGPEDEAAGQGSSPGATRLTATGVLLMMVFAAILLWYFSRRF